MTVTLDVENLRTSFFTLAGEVKAVDDVSFSARRGEVVGLVGESGSGKTVTGLSILRLSTSLGALSAGGSSSRARTCSRFPKSACARFGASRSA